MEFVIIVVVVAGLFLSIRTFNNQRATKAAIRYCAEIYVDHAEFLRQLKLSGKITESQYEIEKQLNEGTYADSIRYLKHGRFQ